MTGEPRWTLEPEGAARRSDIEPRGSTTAGRRSAARALGLSSPSTCERGLLFVPVEKVGNDYYGGRITATTCTATRWSRSTRTPARSKWYQQLVHHDIWDYDLAAHADPGRRAAQRRTIPGVAQITKMGMLFVFNRETGEPMYGMEERPVPQTTAKGEWTSPTQPFPLEARAARAQFPEERGAREGDAGARGVLHRAYGRSTSSRTRCRTTRGARKQDIVVFPGAVGGGNWQGVMFNQPLGLIITNVMNAGQWGHLEERAAGAARPTAARPR